MVRPNNEIQNSYWLMADYTWSNSLAITVGVQTESQIDRLRTLQLGRLQWAEVSCPDVYSFSTTDSNERSETTLSQIFQRRRRICWSSWFQSIKKQQIKKEHKLLNQVQFFASLEFWKQSIRKDDKSPSHVSKQYFLEFMIF